MTMKHEFYVNGVKFVEVTAFGETQWVSELKVMHSNAGYYHGREYYDNEFDCVMPYDRQSDYYSSRESAQFELDMFNANELTEDDDKDVPNLEEDCGYTAEDVLARLSDVQTECLDLLGPGEKFCTCGNIIHVTQVVCSECIEKLNDDCLPF